MRSHMIPMMTLIILIIGTKSELTYPIVDTGNPLCYSNTASIDCGGTEYPMQDGDYSGPKMKYKKNGDDTVTDEVTGLMWQKTYIGTLNYAEAVGNASLQKTGGHSDWRLPTNKQLFSIMDFKGSSINKVPYGDEDYFDFQWGKSRSIDVQFWTSNPYVGKYACNMGVNLADGHIKCYPEEIGQLYVRYVRGNEKYGENKYIDNGDETVSDEATGLMWQKSMEGQLIPSSGRQLLSIAMT